jgi:transcriptional regulator with XRE-family HTH domain
MYNVILFTNILRLLQERKMTKEHLSHASGVSISFISDLTTGKANPSLRTLERIAAALETTVPSLLETVDLPPDDLDTLTQGRWKSSLPGGLVRVSAIVTEPQAFQIRRWDHSARQRLRLRQGHLEPP